MSIFLGVIIFTYGLIAVNVLAYKLDIDPRDPLYWGTVMPLSGIVGLATWGVVAW